jgi:serine/threonine-protein kinase
VSEVIGLGAFGVVYAVADSKLGRELAVKVLRYPMPDMLLRFDREARILAKLRHPAIVPVFFVGEGEGLHYIVMPRLEGNSLRGVLNQARRLDLGETVRITAEAATALDEAHSVGVIHRDVKPENIFLEGSRRRVQVMDFGVAKLLEPTGRLTATGMVLGTIIGTAEYMSPEQCTGDPGIDGRSDIYSLACVAFEMLVGSPPFTGGSLPEIFHKHLTNQPPSVCDSRPELPIAVETIVHRALAKSASDRFTTAGQFAEALSSAA